MTKLTTKMYTLLVIFLTSQILSTLGKSYSKRAVMFKLETNNCKEKNLHERILESQVILSATVKSCQGIRAKTYPCNLQVC